MLQCRNQNGMAPQQRFGLGGPVVTVFEPDYPRRRTPARRQLKEIGICCYDDEPVGSGILPNGLVRCEPDETAVENVDRIREKFSQMANEFRREIRVEKKLQRALRSRPVCEA